MRAMSSCVRCGGFTDDEFRICPECDRVLCARAARVGADEFLVYRDVELPRICVRCGTPASADVPAGRTTRFRRDHPLSYTVLGVLLNLAFPGAVSRRRFAVHVPLCPTHARRARLLRWLGVASVSAIVPILWVGVRSRHDDVLMRCGFYSFAAAFGGLILVWISGRSLRATDINDLYARFAGAGEPFLAQLERD